MSNFSKHYTYKTFNIYKLVKIGYCFITNTTHNVNDTPTYEDILFIKEKLDLNDDEYDIIFHFDGVFGLIVLKDDERLFSKQIHHPSFTGQLKVVSSYFDKISNLIDLEKPIQLD